MCFVTQRSPLSSKGGRYWCPHCKESDAEETGAYVIQQAHVVPWPSRPPTLPHRSLTTLKQESGRKGFHPGPFRCHNPSTRRPRAPSQCPRRASQTRTPAARSQPGAPSAAASPARDRPPATRPGALPQSRGPWLLGGAAQPTLSLQAADDVRPGQRVPVEAQHVRERGRRRGLYPRSERHRGHRGGARLAQDPPDVQEEHRQLGGVHGGLAGLVSRASAPYILGLRRRPASFLPPWGKP